MGWKWSGPIRSQIDKDIIGCGPSISSKDKI